MITNTVQLQLCGKMGHFKHKSVLVTVVVAFQMFVSINSQGKNKFAITVFPRISVSFEHFPPLNSFRGQKLLIIYTFLPWTFFSFEWKVICLLFSLKSSKRCTKCSNHRTEPFKALFLQYFLVTAKFIHTKFGPFWAVLKILQFS